VFAAAFAARFGRARDGVTTVERLGRRLAASHRRRKWREKCASAPGGLVDES